MSKKIAFGSDEGYMILDFATKQKVIDYLYNSLNFLKDNSDAMARKVMFASFVYLPVVLITLVLDKYV